MASIQNSIKCVVIVAVIRTSCSVCRCIQSYRHTLVRLRCDRNAPKQLV